MEDVIDQMRRAINITDLGNGRAVRRKGSPRHFAISFSYSDKYKAQAVVRELVSKFTEETNNQLRQQANTTTLFLNDQLKAAKETIDRLDGEMAKFKMENAGRLPDQLQSNLQAVNSLELQAAEPQREHQSGRAGQDDAGDPTPESGARVYVYLAPTRSRRRAGRP